MGENNTFAIGAGQAAINTGTGFLGNVMGRVFGPRDRKNQLEQQNKLNEQAYDINNRMAEANYQRDLRMWEATNYDAQKEQMKKAGLNPALMYGMNGGGGQTAAAAGSGSGVGAGQAAQARQGMAIEAPSIMQLEIMKAQKENIDADTANKKAENPNIGLTGENIKAQTQNLLQGIQNQKAQQALTNVQTELLNIDKNFANDSYEDRLNTVTMNLNRGLAVLASEEAQGRVDQNTVNEKISILKSEAATAAATTTLTEVETSLTREKINLTKAEQDKISQEINNMKMEIIQTNEKLRQGSVGLTIEAQNSNIAAIKTKIEEKMNQWKQEHPEISSTIGGIISDMKGKFDKITGVNYHNRK